MKSLLSAITFPTPTSKFFEHYQSNTPLVVHNLKESVNELTELDFLQSLESLMKFWPKQVDSYLPGIADEVNSTTTSVQEAKESFNKGRALLFNDADTVSPVLEKWAKQLKDELGFSQLTYARSLIYAVAAGQGTAPHFDQNINFVLQIHGTKKWWIAPNQHVQNPMTRHTIGTDTDPELASYTQEMPDSFAKDATEYILKPGSFLFVPRGAWHRTEAVDDTLALNFTFTAPTWIDILTTAMRGRLAQSPEWRESADFVTDKERCHEAIGKFNTLLSELAYEIPSWRAEDILHATEADKFPLNLDD